MPFTIVDRSTVPSWKRWLLPVLLAGLLTSINALKPPCIDDPAYLAVARQIAEHPADPYGFQQFWYSHRQPANEVLAPPVVPYWLGIGMVLLGDRPEVLRIWMFPPALMLALAMQALLRRFARGFDSPFLIALLLSPIVLPGFNFMLDLPALALECTALALLLRSLHRNQPWLSIAAGLIAGLAIQTKYNAGLIVPVMVVTALMYRRVARAVAVAGAAAAVFLTWEVFTHARYGASHFLVALGSSKESLIDRPWLAMSALTLVGGLGPPIVLLAVAVLVRRRIFTGLAAVAMLAGFATLVVVPDARHSLWLPSELRIGSGFTRPLFLTWGSLFFATTGLVILRLHLGGTWRVPRMRFRRPAVMLAFWLLLEWLGYLAMTPFPATRRVLGAILVTGFLVARLAAVTCRSSRGRASVAWAVGPCVAVGLLFGIVDVMDSRLEPEALRQALAVVREREPSARIWYTGHWGFQYEAERHGLRPLVPDESVLQPGDWLIDAPPWIAKQEFTPDERMGPPVHVVRIDLCLPVRTIPPYYGGHRVIEAWPGPAIEVRIHRITERWMPMRD